MKGSAAFWGRKEEGERQMIRKWEEGRKKITLKVSILPIKTYNTSE